MKAWLPNRAASKTILINIKVFGKSLGNEDFDEIRTEVLRAASRSSRRRPEPEPEPGPARGEAVLPDPHDRLLATERATAKLLIQVPGLFRPGWDGLTSTDFTHPAYAAVFTAVEKAAGALAWARRNLDRYASIGGEMNPRQPELIGAAAARVRPATGSADTSATAGPPLKRGSKPRPTTSM